MMDWMRKISMEFRVKTRREWSVHVVLSYANDIAEKRWKGKKGVREERDWQVIHWETEQKAEKKKKEKLRSGYKD